MINGIVHRNTFRNTCHEVTLATKILHVSFGDRNWTSAVRRKENSQYFHAFLTLVLESRNGQPHTRFRSYVQREYKIISHIQNDTDKKLGALRTSNLCRSIERLSNFRFKWLGECRCAPLLLDVTRLANGYTTTKELVCPSVGEERETTALQSVFQSQFDRGPCSRYSIYVGCKTFGQERCICEGKCPSMPSVSGATVQSVSAYCRSSSQKSMRLGVPVRHCALNARCTAVTVSSCAKCRAHQHVRCGVGCGGSHFQS